VGAVGGTEKETSNVAGRQDSPQRVPAPATGSSRMVVPERSVVVRGGPRRQRRGPGLGGETPPGSQYPRAISTGKPPLGHRAERLHAVRLVCAAVLAAGRVEAPAGAAGFRGRGPRPSAGTSSIPAWWGGAPSTRRATGATRRCWWTCSA